MKQLILANDGSAGPMYSGITLSSSLCPPDAYVVARSKLGQQVDVVLSPSSMRRLSAWLQTEFPERRKSPDRRKA